MSYRAYKRYIHDSRYFKPRRTTYSHRRRSDVLASSLRTATIPLVEEPNEDELFDCDLVANKAVENINSPISNEEVNYPFIN